MAGDARDTEAPTFVPPPHGLATVLDVSLADEREWSSPRRPSSSAGSDPKPETRSASKLRRIVDLPGAASPWQPSEMEGTKQPRQPSKTSVQSISTAKSSVFSTFSEAVNQYIEVVQDSVDPLACTVILAGAMLASCAGMVNAIAFLELNTFVSHATGALSKVGVHTEKGAAEQARDSALVLMSFIIGSTICGCLITKNTVSFGDSLYGFALIGNAILLLTASLTTEDVAPYLAAAACGLQNGMATSYSGAVIRTTHVTGIFTDVGLIIGRLIVRFLRTKVPFQVKKKANDEYLDLREVSLPVRDEVRKLMLLVVLASSFLVGVIVGAMLFFQYGQKGFLFPASIGAVAGTSYMIYRHCYREKPCFGASPTSCTQEDDKVRDKGDSHREDTIHRLAEKCAELEEENTKLRQLPQCIFAVPPAPASGLAPGMYAAPPTTQPDELALGVDFEGPSSILRHTARRHSSPQFDAAELVVRRLRALEQLMGELPPPVTHVTGATQDVREKVGEKLEQLINLVSEAWRPREARDQ